MTAWKPPDDPNDLDAWFPISTALAKERAARGVKAKPAVSREKQWTQYVDAMMRNRLKSRGLDYPVLHSSKYGLTVYVIDVNNLKSLRLIQETLNGQLRFVAGLKGVMDEISRALEQDILIPLIGRLRRYPPEPVHPPPPRWRSRKQQRYVMMLIKQGKWTGRTYALAGGWKGKVRVRGAGAKRGIEMDISNTESYTEFVVGHLGIVQSPSEMRKLTKPMQPFHRDTGWKPVAPIVRAAYTQAQAQATAMLEAALLEGLKPAKAKSI